MPPFVPSELSPPSPDNVALLNRVAVLDAAAFAELYENFADPMFSLVLRIVESHADAEDVLQLGFLKVWRCAPHYREHLGSPAAWIATIMRRKAIDSLRGRWRRLPGIDMVSQLRSESPETRPGDAHLVLSERRASVRGAVFQLNLAERSAIQLAFFDGFTNAEIAEALGASLGTVKSRIRRGMMKLRRNLADASAAAI